MTPRLAVEADVAGVRACVRAAYAHYVERIGREPAPMIADYAALVARGVVWVIGDASVEAVLVMYPSPTESGDALFIENIAVAPGQQGRGLGRALLDFAERYARQHGLPELRLYTNALMTENLAMYAHLGFVESDRRTKDGFQRVYLRKPLGA